MQTLPRSVHIPLPGDLADALYELSRREYRHPRQQAAYLLAEGLRRAGALGENNGELGKTTHRKEMPGAA